MSFSDSQPVKIALSNPVDKFGKTYKISNIFLADSSYEQEINNVPEAYTLLSNFHQNLDGRQINLKWEIIDPRDGHTIKTTEEVSKSPYISGLDITVYQNSGELRGKDVINNRTKIFETGVKDIKFNYSIPEDADIRNYSVDVKLTDVFENQNSGLFTTRNLEPDFVITSTSFENGFYNIFYSGITDDNNNDISNGLEYIKVYNFTGLTSGTSGFFSQEQDFLNTNVNYVTGEYGSAQIELSPGDNNYVMVLGVDGFGTGHHKGVYQFREYVTGEGFSGISVAQESPRLLRYDPEVINLQDERISGGDALYFSFDGNYNTGSSLLKTCYGISGTGVSSQAVLGYNDPIFLASGIFYGENHGYGIPNPGQELLYDNSLYWQSGFYTGELYQEATVSGVDFTGSGTFGSGAGYLWLADCPKYSGYELVTGDYVQGGIFHYGYYSADTQGFGCASREEALSNIYNISGIYSMPANDPNSYEIEYHTGPRFNKTYEQAASYLNAIGKMPAVILNQSQLSKIQNMNAGKGWVGLRRKKVGVLKNVFSEEFINQAFFNGTDFTEEESRSIQAVNSLNQLESSMIVINDVGDHWAWVNSSGTHIYKYAGSGYEKIREANLSIDITRNRDDQVLFNTGYTGNIKPIELNEITFQLINGVINFEYDFVDNYYDTQPESELYQENYNIVGLDLFTGYEPNFVANENSFMDRYDIQYNDAIEPSGIIVDTTKMQTGISVDFSQTLTKPPSYYKMLPYDTVGSGILADANEKAGGIEIKPAIRDQVSILSLDDAKQSNTNCVNLEFKFNHLTPPIVTFGLSYTGAKDTMSYLGAMIKGAPTVSNVEFILTEVPPDTGYCLYVYSSNS
jgi:hypothetical protein